MPKFTVYFRGLIDEIRLLYLFNDNKKNKKDLLSWLVVGVVYIIGLCLLFSLAANKSLIFGELCTLILSLVFIYNITRALKGTGRFNLYSDSSDYLINDFHYMLVMFLICVLLLYSLITIHRIISTTY
jgi:multisubunit Na+/H+ antiporter MnhB subunit